MAYTKPKVSQPNPPRGRKVTVPIPDRAEKPKKPAPPTSPVDTAKPSAVQVPNKAGKQNKQ